MRVFVYLLMLMFILGSLAVLLVSVNSKSVDPFVLIAIKETWGVSRYNYTIPIVIDNTNFQYWNLINVSNIYFTDINGTPLYYWIETLNVTPGQYYGRFWVKIPYIPAYGTVYIEMHFGGSNPYTSYDNPREVFIFWRGFGSLGGNYTIYLSDSSTDYVTTSGGNVILYANGTNTYGSVVLDYNTGISMQDIQVILKATWYYANQLYPIAGVYVSDGSILTYTSSTNYNIYIPNHGYMYAFFGYNSTIYKLNNTVSTLATGSSVPSGYSFTVIFTRHGAGLIGQNGIDSLSAYDYTYTNMTHIGLFIWESRTGSSTSYTELVVDWLAVRRFIAPDPTVTVVNGTTTTVTNTTTSTVTTSIVSNGTVTVPSYQSFLTVATLFIIGFIASLFSLLVSIKRYKYFLLVSLSSLAYNVIMMFVVIVIPSQYTLVNGTWVPVGYMYKMAYIFLANVIMSIAALLLHMVKKFRRIIGWAVFE